jgi:hypothetical protein
MAGLQDDLADRDAFTSLTIGWKARIELVFHVNTSLIQAFWAIASPDVTQGCRSELRALNR